MTQRFQFSLRALMILVLAVACFLGGVRFGRERQRREDEAVIVKHEADAAVAKAEAAVAHAEADQARADVADQQSKLGSEPVWKTLPPLEKQADELIGI